MRMTVKDLVFMAMYMAMFMALDVIVNYYQILQMPQGGSLGVSVIPLLICSYHLGWKKGVLSCVCAVMLMFITGPMYTPNILGFLLDYLFAFGVYGFASILPNYRYFYTGVLVSNVIRYVLHVVSGMIIWQTPLWGSLTYNFFYMAATLVLCMVMVPLLMSRISPLKR
ncbi:MAG: energy-coupled thiamine transporter ThiT [Erysipelotrichaceae bacterium]